MDNLKSYQDHLRNRYRIFIGYWRGALRAKSMENGQFVSLKDVKALLKGEH